MNTADREALKAAVDDARRQRLCPTCEAKADVAREARRRSWRESSRRRYGIYQALTAELGVARRARWCSHLAELRKAAA